MAKAKVTEVARTPLQKVEAIIEAMSQFDEGPFSAEIKRHMSKADNHMQEVAAILEDAGL
jgi:hypothetical protein